MIAAALIVLACGGGNENSNTGANPAATRVASSTPAGSVASGLPGTEYPSNGNDHIAVGQAHGRYFSNPPTSGWHYPELPSPGIYDTVLTPEDVGHFIEHGGVWVLYNCPQGCADVVNQLVPVVNTATQAGKPVALARYEQMDKKIALVAWQRLQTLDAPDTAKIQTFIDKLACRYNPEGGGICKETRGTVTAARDAAQGSPTPAPSVQAKRYASPPAMQIDPNKTYIATIKTEKGDIVVELNAKAAPTTVNNFVFLARDHYYDGVIFHRVIPGFVAQGGDPTGTGTGGPGYTILDEQSGLKHDEGVVAMAKTAAPNSAGSQFYITLAPQPALDAGYTVFGKVISGLDVAKQITPRDPSKTNQPPGDRILTITIDER